MCHVSYTSVAAIALSILYAIARAKYLPRFCRPPDSARVFSGVSLCFHSEVVSCAFEGRVRTATQLVTRTGTFRQAPSARTGTFRAEGACHSPGTNQPGRNRPSDVTNAPGAVRVVI